MIRFLLYMIAAYFLWKVIRVFAATPQKRGRPSDDAEARKPARPDLSNAKEADFEELPPEPPSDKPGPKP